jgi:S-formylglutathione hydrolase
LSAYLGNDRETWNDYDACMLVTQSTHPHEILIDQGTADGFLSEQLKPELFESACRLSGQALRLRMQEGYDHSYFFIASFMADHISHAARALGQAC